MKKVLILAACLIPAEGEGQMKTAYPDSVLELDDDVAGNLVASQRAKYADKGAKLLDTTKEHETEAAKRAAAVSTPEAIMAAAVASAVKAALAAQSEADVAKPPKV